ncbi:MAG TPA: hypothetical protein VKY74_05075, partial [Chloroflexia bacterium]|nr:hypothetical protein [Chloroflexia bacterium]
AAETLLTTPALASALAAGDWPPAVLPALTAAGLALLPGADDLAADCACGARPPCRHVAALCYLFAEALESDPWLLPLLRGRDRAALAQTLAAARARLVPEESTPPPPEEPAPLPAARQGPVPPDSPPRAGPEGEQAAPTFWDVGGALEGFYAEIAAPAQAAPLLRQLGPPPFWTPAAAFLGHLEPVYQAVTAAVLRLALGEEDMV